MPNIIEIIKQKFGNTVFPNLNHIAKFNSLLHFYSVGYAVNNVAYTNYYLARFLLNKGVAA